MSDSRDTFAKAFGAAKEKMTGASAESTDTVDPEVQVQAEPTQEVTKEAPEGEPELLDAQKKLAPKEGDSEQVAFDKKEMLKMVNRALRKGADARKSVDVGEIDTLRQKAAALDLVLKSPDAGAALQQLKGAFGTNGQGTGNLDQMEKELRESFKNDAAFEDFGKMMDWWTQKNLIPKFMPVVDGVSGLMQRTVQTDWEKLQDKYGDGIDDWKDEAFKTAREMNMPLKKALIYVSDGEVVNMEKEAKDKRASKKSITTPTQGNGAATNLRAKPKASTREERIQHVAQGVRKTGIEPPWARFMK